MGFVTSAPPTLDGEFNHGILRLGVDRFCAVAYDGTVVKAWMWLDAAWKAAEGVAADQIRADLDPPGPPGRCWRGLVVLDKIPVPVLCTIAGATCFFWGGDDWIELLSHGCIPAVLRAWAKHLERVAQAEQDLRKAVTAHTTAWREGLDLTATARACDRAEKALRMLGRDP